MQPTTEDEFAAKIGLSRAAVKKLRAALKPQTHYFKNGNAIYLTAAGQIAIRRRLSKAAAPEPKEEPQEAVDNSARQTPEPEEKPQPHKTAAAIVERRAANRRILFCTVDGLPRQCVKVRDNSNFVEGMAISVRKMREPGLWAMEGNCPRWKGRF